MRKKNLVFHFIIISFIVFLSFGCKKGPTAISYGDPSIRAELTYYDQLDLPSASVEVEGTELLPIVTINNDTLELSGCNPKGEYMWESYFRGDVSTTSDNEYELRVSHAGGEATGSITLPGNFEFTSIQEDDTLNQNEDLIVNWNPSEGAEKYNLSVRLSYYYGDTADPTYSSFRLDTILSKMTTVLTLEKEKIFSPEIDSILEGYGYIYLNAENGPQIGASSEGNISGEGIGYFTAVNTRPVSFLIEDASN
jgi:hypothetical protein